MSHNFLLSVSPRQNGVDAVEGRTHRTIQTESWLEEIKGRVESSHQGVQTEAPIHYTPPEIHQRHLMVPPKGVDKCTQILPGIDSSNHSITTTIHFMLFSGHQIKRLVKKKILR